jgi:DNA repair exonuclease SbcCD ATPase subunit
MTTWRDDPVAHLGDHAGAADTTRTRSASGNTLPGERDAGQAEEIRAALDADEEFAALEVLRLALPWAITVLRREGLAAAGSAFRAVAVADRALAAAPEFFAALSVLVARADPAPEVAADLRRYAEQAGKINRETAPLRERLAALQQAEGRLRAEAAHQDQILARIAELERIQRLAAQVGALRAQHDMLVERTREASATVLAAEDDLGQAAGPLITLTHDALGSLTKRTRALLERAAEQDRMLREQIAEHQAAARQAAADTERARAELTQAEADAESALAEYHRAHTQAKNRLSALRRYQSENRDVADALANREPRAADQVDPLADALRVLTEVETRLAEVDALLHYALSQGKD